MNIERLIADKRLVALTRRQDLEPVEDREAPVHPPDLPRAAKRPGGVVARGGIVQRAVVLLDVLRRYRTGDASDVLPACLLALALGGLVTGGRSYHLRSGCALVAGLERRAEAWSLASGVALGGEPRVHPFDPALARRMLKAPARGVPGRARNPQHPHEEQDG